MIERTPLLSTRFSKLVNRIYSLFSPATPDQTGTPMSRQTTECLLCLAPSHAIGLCIACHKDLPWLEQACHRCGLPLEGCNEDGAMINTCRPCLGEPPAFQKAEIAMLYDFPVNRLISRYKFSGHRPSGRLLAQLLIQRLQQRTEPLPELLIPCPMHKARFYQRGFNQSAELAEWIGQALQIPVSYTLCTRPKATRAQVGQQREARLRNLRKAFRVEGQPPVHIAIIDDVVTTGATLQQMSRLLQSAGADRIEIWALARTEAQRKLRDQMSSKQCRPAVTDKGQMITSR